MRLTGIAALAAAGVFAASAVASAAPSPLPLLRPPGAGAPEHFAARCVRCGRCLEACPYQAIHAAPLNARRSAGTSKAPVGQTAAQGNSTHRRQAWDRAFTKGVEASRPAFRGAA